MPRCSPGVRAPSGTSCGLPAAVTRLGRAFRGSPLASEPVPLDPLRVPWAAHEEALDLWAPQLPEALQLLLRLHALGGDRGTEVPGERQHGRDDRVGRAVVG